MHPSYKQLTLSDGIPIFLLKLEPEPVPSLRLRLRNIVFLQYEYIKPYLSSCPERITASLMGDRSSCGRGAVDWQVMSLKYEYLTNRF